MPVWGSGASGRDAHEVKGGRGEIPKEGRGVRGCDAHLLSELCGDGLLVQHIYWRFGEKREQLDLTPHFVGYDLWREGEREGGGRGWGRQRGREGKGGKKMDGAGRMISISRVEMTRF